jgi:calcium homeostasis ER protein
MPPDFLSRPPPVAALNAPQNFSCEGIEPKAPYFDLPAGLLVPLVKMEDSDYKSIDPKDIRLPAPLPPSERLIAAIDFFYSPLSHDRPRNADGFVTEFFSRWLIIELSFYRWEQMALFEFYKNKGAAKKEKEEDIDQGLREMSPPRTPIETVEDHSPERSGKNGIKSPVRRRFRSESPEEEHREESRQARSRSRSPKNSSTRRRRSRSNSESPRQAVRSRSPTPSRSESRSSSPAVMTGFAQKRSPTPPSEM